MLNLIKILREKFTMIEIHRIRTEVKALSTELHLFETDVLVKMDDNINKLSKRLQMKLKRDGAEEEHTELSDDGMDEIRKISKLGDQ